MPSCRQTSAALHRSVHTASTAWAFSGALWALAAGRGRDLIALFEVVDEFFVFVSIVDREFEFSFFGPQDHRLTFHAADHVEGRFGLSAQGQLQEIVLDTGLEGLAQLRGDFEITVRRAKAFDALVGPFVIVIFDPELDALAGRFEALELGANQELLPDRRPEPFDLA